MCVWAFLEGQPLQLPFFAPSVDDILPEKWTFGLNLAMGIAAGIGEHKKRET